MICDFAETYNIYDYRGLACKTAACLAYGLREDSRSKKLLSGIKTDNEQLLLATISDSVRLIAWMLSEDGRKNINRPKSLVTFFIGDGEDSAEAVAFESGKDFEAAWSELTGGM